MWHWIDTDANVPFEKVHYGSAVQLEIGSTDSAAQRASPLYFRSSIAQQEKHIDKGTKARACNAAQSKKVDEQKLFRKGEVLLDKAEPVKDPFFRRQDRFMRFETHRLNRLGPHIYLFIMRVGIPEHNALTFGHEQFIERIGDVARAS